MTVGHYPGLQARVERNVQAEVVRRVAKNVMAEKKKVKLTQSGGAMAQES
ncbi:MAG: hypothetical protein KA191_06185 [Verrucomicrobia bacterium]|jgi:hypothetical protein|nr:hypothetical protein [Verrucomicrobiota bacterium]OQC65793.1 MAG: hypothetical protein BWX48_02148 [Verrucomicrobia bacterium ADurb.Bin006]MDI9381703.1 hypothetical protein [Verrucomicrobiota bacterium]NMD19445.1 hypothetical protein [Verrucomicrobiota bacterium]HOA63182.1 hypothetical protein [Verrucomicrobiota bacterium]